MNDYSHFYATEVTDETRKELVDFIHWHNKIYKHDPLIIGGWAAWAYHHGLGSKDIDVIFPGQKTQQIVLETFLTNHGFVRQDVGAFEPPQWVKIRRTKDGKEIPVYIDDISAQGKQEIYGTPFSLAWSLAEKFRQAHEFAPGTTAYIIDPELLFIYKIGALVGRDSKLNTEPEQQRPYFDSKLWKDARDVLGLLEKTELDYAKVFYIMRKAGLPLGTNLLDRALNVSYRYFEKPEQTRFVKLFGELSEAVDGYESVVQEIERGENYDITSLRPLAKYEDLMLEITDAIASNLKKKVRENQRKATLIALNELCALDGKADKIAVHVNQRYGKYLENLKTVLSGQTKNRALFPLLITLKLMEK